MLESIKSLDTSLFLWFNSKHSPFWDSVMYWASHDFFWIWLYVIFLALLIPVYKKRTLLVLPLVALMILVSDQSANLFKNKIVKRVRPCYNLNIKDQVHLNVKADQQGNRIMPGRHGFVSSHASNTFALAFFLSMLLMKRYRYIPLVVFAWAAFVSYSRIYNGVHYPLDIIGGAATGLLAGFLAWKLWQFVSRHFIQKTVS